jgi:GNAT superfamily N-acetyltransferase
VTVPGRVGPPPAPGTVLPKVAPIVFATHPAESRFWTTQKAYARARQAKGVMLPEGTAQAKRLLDGSLAELGGALPGMQQELTGHLAAIRQEDQSLTQAEAGYGRGRPNNAVREALRRQREALAAKVTLYEERRKQVERYQKRWQAWATSLGDDFPHGGTQYPEEVEQPNRVVEAIRGFFVGGTVAAEKAFAAHRRALMATGQYPTLPPLPASARTPEARARFIREKNQVVSDLQAAETYAMTPENSPAAWQRLTGGYTSWQQQLVPVVRQQIAAERQAGERAQIARGQAADLAGFLAGWYVGGAVAGKVAGALAGRIPAAILSRAPTLAPAIPTVLGGTAGGGVGSATAAATVTGVLGGTPAEMARAAGGAALPGAALGAGAGVLAYVYRPAAQILAQKWSERTPALVNEATATAQRRFGLTDPAARQYRQLLEDLVRDEALSVPQKRQILKDVIAGLRPGMTELPPVAPPVEAYAAPGPRPRGEYRAAPPPAPRGPGAPPARPVGARGELLETGEAPPVRPEAPPPTAAPGRFQRIEPIEAPPEAPAPTAGAPLQLRPPPPARGPVVQVPEVGEVPLRTTPTPRLAVIAPQSPPVQQHLRERDAYAAWQAGTPPPAETAGRHGKEWDAEKNPARLQVEAFRKAAATATEQEVTDALTSAAAVTTAQWNQQFRRRVQDPNVTVDELNNAVAPPEASPWRQLTPAQQQALPVPVQTALLVQDATNSLQVLDPRRPAAFTPREVGARNRQELEEQADRLFDHAQSHAAIQRVPISSQNVPTLDEAAQQQVAAGPAGASIQPRGATAATTPRAQPATAGPLQVGQRVRSPNVMGGQPLEIVDTSDPSMVTVRTPAGGTARIGRGALADAEVVPAVTPAAEAAPVAGGQQEPALVTTAPAAEVAPTLTKKQQVGRTAPQVRAQKQTVGRVGGKQAQEKEQKQRQQDAKDFLRRQALMEEWSNMTPEQRRARAASMSREEFVRDYSHPVPEIGEIEALAGLAARGKPGIHIEEPSHISMAAVYRDDAGKPRGVLRWLGKKGEPARVLEDVWVHPGFRRQGIASRLYAAADAAGYDITRKSGMRMSAQGAALFHARATKQQLPEAEPATKPTPKPKPTPRKKVEAIAKPAAKEAAPRPAAKETAETKPAVTRESEAARRRSEIGKHLSRFETAVPVHWSAESQRWYRQVFEALRDRDDARLQKLLAATPDDQRNLRKWFVEHGHLPPEPALEGTDTTFKAGDETYTARWAVYEIGDVVTSHDDALNVNPAYPKELQPRDRTRQAYREQVAEIAQEFDPAQMGENYLAQHGAPIVGADGAVESGNGRTIALNRLYERKDKRAKAYRRWLGQNAGTFGLNPEALSGVKQPILVRVRTTELSPEARVAFTRTANERETAELGDVEQAQVDAERLTPKLMTLFDPGESGELDAATNRPFVRAFIEAIPTTEQGKMRTAEGTVSSGGLRRIRNAVFQFVYGDVEALTRLAESTDDPARNITSGMLRAAGHMADLKRRIDAETAYPVSIAADVAKSAGKIAALRASGETVTGYLAQVGTSGQDLFGRDMTDFQRKILVHLEANKKSAKRIAAILTDYVDLAVKAGDPGSGILFEESVPPDKETLWQAAVDRATRTASDEPGLFTEEVAGVGAGEAVARPAETLREADEVARGAAVEEGAGTRAEGVAKRAKPKKAPAKKAEEVQPKSERLSYAEAVRANLEHMGTPSNEWKSTEIGGFAETEDDRGRAVSMPEFVFPQGYTNAPTLYNDEGECGLCGTTIKNVFWLQNDTKRWTLPVGSECVKKFSPAGQSGETLAKEAKWAENRALADDAIRLRNALWNAYTVVEHLGYGKTRRGFRFDAGPAAKVHTELKKLTEGVEIHHPSYPPDNATVTRWANKNGARVRELMHEASQMVEAKKGPEEKGDLRATTAGGTIAGTLAAKFEWFGGWKQIQKVGTVDALFEPKEDLPAVRRFVAAQGAQYRRAYDLLANAALTRQEREAVSRMGLMTLREERATILGLNLSRENPAWKKETDLAARMRLPQNEFAIFVNPFHMAKPESTLYREVVGVGLPPSAQMATTTVMTLVHEIAHIRSRAEGEPLWQLMDFMLGQVPQATFDEAVEIIRRAITEGDTGAYSREYRTARGEYLSAVWEGGGSVTSPESARFARTGPEERGGEQRGIRGRGGRVRSDRGEDQGVTAPRNAVQAFYQRNNAPPRNEDPARMREKIKTTIENARRRWRHLPRTAEFAELRLFLNRLEQGRDIASQEAMIEMADVVRGLSTAEFALFAEALVTRDLLEQVNRWNALVADGKAEGEAVLADGLTEAEVLEAVDDLNARLAGETKVTEALKRRREAMERIKTEYQKAVTAVLGRPPKMDREDYFRHQVLKYLAEERSAPRGTGQQVKAPVYRGFLKERGFTAEAYSTNWIEAEHEVLSQMIYDTMLYRLLKYVEKWDVKPQLMAQAAALNEEGFREELAEMAGARHAPIGAEPGTAQEPLRPGPWKFAGAVERLRRLARSGELPDTPQGTWAGLIVALKGDQLLTSDEMQDVARYAAWLHSQTHVSASPAAARIAHDLRRRVKWQDLIPATHMTWQPQEGNAFYRAWSVPDRIAEQVQEEGGNAAIGLDPSDLRRVFAMGGKRRMLVLPRAVGNTLNGFTRPYLDSLEEDYRHLHRKFLGAWKAYQLLNPERLIGYNLRNEVGDLEASLFNPDGLRYMIQALDELVGFMAKHRHVRESPSASLRAWLRRGGLQATLQAAEQVGSGVGIDLLAKFAARDTPLTRKAWNAVWSRVRGATDLREAVARYAHFLSYRAQIEASAVGLPRNYGSSDRHAIAKIADYDDRAYKLSNELIGAYDDVSEFGRLVATHFIPFWRWQEVNWRRTMGLLANAWQEGAGRGGGGGPLGDWADDDLPPWSDPRRCLAAGRKVAQLAGIRLAGASIGGLIFLGAAAIKMHVLTWSLYAWNRAKWGNLIDKIPEHDRGRPLLIVGYDAAKDEVMYYTRLGAFPDIAAWFGYDNLLGYGEALANGRMSLSELAVKMLVKTPAEKILTALGPTATAFEILLGRKLFPEPFDPRPIQNKVEYAMDALAVGDLYRRIFAGTPVRRGAGWQRLLGMHVAQLGEANFGEMRGLGQRFLEKKDKGGGGGERNKKGNAIWAYKQSLKRGDPEMALRWLIDYRQHEGTDETYAASMKTQDPLYGMNDADEAEFLASLSPRDQQRLIQAYRYWGKLHEAKLPAEEQLAGKKFPAQVRIVRDRIASAIDAEQPMRRLEKGKPVRILGKDVAASAGAR